MLKAGRQLWLREEHQQVKAEGVKEACATMKQVRTPGSLEEPLIPHCHPQITYQLQQGKHISQGRELVNVRETKRSHFRTTSREPPDRKYTVPV